MIHDPKGAGGQSQYSDWHNFPHTNTPKVWVSGWFGMQASETITATSTWSLRRTEVPLMVPNPKP